MPVDLSLSPPGETAAPLAMRRPGWGGWRVPVVLMTTDILVLQAIVLVATALRAALTAFVPMEMNLEAYQGVHLAVLFLPLLYIAAGLNPGYGRAAVERMRGRITVTGTFFAAMFLFDHIAQGGQWSRGIMLIAAFLALILMPMVDALLRLVLIRYGYWGMPVAVLGPMAERQRLIAALHAHAELGWVPAVEGDGPPTPPPLSRGINLALLATDGLDATALAQADRLPFRKVVLAGGLTDMQSQWVAARDLGGQLGLEMQRNLLLPWNRFIKRVMDMALGLLLLPAAVLICLPFVLGVVILSPGPIFYSQPRRGLNGALFPILKLRSMYPDADARLQQLLDTSPAAREEWEAAMKLRHDPRLIPGVARIMRRLSIDELPQLLNVLRGEMSIVGPRPLPDYHLEALADSARTLRAKVRPGITGLWQVSGRSSLPLEEMERLDSYYVRNWSIWLDIYVLARTGIEVIRGRGAW